MNVEIVMPNLAALRAAVFTLYLKKNFRGADIRRSVRGLKQKKSSELLRYGGFSDVMAHRCSVPTFQFANYLKSVT